MNIKRIIRTFSNWVRPGSAALAIAGLAFGCAAGEAEVIGAETARPAGVGKDLAGKADHWNWANSPDRFNLQLEYAFDKLPREGRAERTPWPDTYWATYQDSINVQWSGRGVLSPAQKYDLAFNGWKVPEGFTDLKPYEASNCESKGWSKEYYEKLGPAAKWTSDNKGNLHARDGLDNDKDGKTDECDDRDGVETWWGLCHAWVPAAMLESEPKRAVTYNGVTFEVSDIKALLISQYDRSQATMIGGRCNDKEVKRDEKTGRILDEQCRDTNAGTWHIVMSNMLGLMKRALAEDRTYNYEVWNQPVVEFKVHDMEEIDLAKATSLLKLEVDKACTADTECSVKVGTQDVNFGACVESKCTVTKYPYNANATKFYEVDASSFYITESHASTEPFTDVISEYTREDRYQYLLEVNKDGKIDGGEWIGNSNTNHPDFLWLPTAARGGNPSIDIDQVRMLVEMSLRPAEEEGPAADLLVYENTNAFDIKDNDPAGVNSTIDVPDAMVVNGLTIEVDITHPFIGDLTVTLKKGDKTYVLHDKAGGSTDNLKRTFTVPQFDGLEANGTWELIVADTAQSDVGKLNTWKLKLKVAGGTTPPADSGTQVAESTTPVTLKDNDATGVNGSLQLADSKQIRGLKVSVDIAHTYVGALNVELRHGAVRATLSASEGGDATELVKTFDVTAFNGQESGGAWELWVIDTDAYGDSGKLNSWKLEIEY